MAANIANSTTYDSGSGGFFATHTVSGFNTSGANPYLLVESLEKNPGAELSGITADGNSMGLLAENLNVNVTCDQLYGIIPSDSSTDIVASTPSFKEQAMGIANLNGVDQTTPYNTTVVKTNGFGASSTAAITGTSGSLLISTVATQNDQAFTPSNCTEQIDLSPANTIGAGFMGYVTATGSSQTIGATWTGNTNHRLINIEFYSAASGTNVNDNRDAVLVGESTANANRDAVTTGEDTANANRDAVTTGEASANDNRDATLLGAGLLAEEFMDDFDDNSIDSVKWLSVWGGAQIAETGGQLELTSTLGAGYYGIDSRILDLTGSYLQLYLVDAGNQSITSFEAYPSILILDADNSLLWQVAGGTIYAKKHVATSFTDLYSATYSSTTHKYLRIREDSGTVYWDSSTDGVNWTNRASELVSNLFDISGLYLQVMVGTWQAEGSTTTMIIDDVNVFGSSASDNRDAVLVGEDSANDSRDAVLIGEDTDNDSRDAILYGENTANNNRDAILVGEDTASDSRDAVLIGENTDNDSRDAVIIGEDTSNDSRDASLVGEDSSDDFRDAKTTGKQLTNDNRNAIVVGKDAINDSRDASLIGQNTANGNRDAVIYGIDTDSDNRDAALIGQDSTNAERGAKIIGEILIADNRSGKITGESTANANRDARTAGQNTANASRAAKLTGYERVAKLMSIF